jgi:hypothetical protein
MLVRNVFGAENAGAAQLAHYLIAEAAALDARPIAEITCGASEAGAAA